MKKIISLKFWKTYWHHLLCFLIPLLDPRQNGGVILDFLLFCHIFGDHIASNLPSKLFSKLLYVSLPLLFFLMKAAIIPLGFWIPIPMNVGVWGVKGIFPHNTKQFLDISCNTKFYTKFNTKFQLKVASHSTG